MTVLTLLPITFVFAFLQRYITTGIATTGHQVAWPPSSSIASSSATATPR